MADSTSWLACFRGCEGRWSPFEVIYHCPSCGGLLEVRHDEEVLARTSAGTWRELFDSRLRSAAWPSSSGVWGKREWVLPEVPDDDIVSLYEGATPLLPAPAFARQAGGVGDLWIKQCGHSHTGSFKDLGMTVLVSAVRSMRRRGVGIRAVACASTGDTSAALAAYCAAAAIPAVVLLPAGKISTAQLVQPVANGAIVLALDTDFDGCMGVVRELTEDAGSGLYLANSLNSLRVEGQKTVAVEIVQQLGWEPVDWIVIPGGNLGNVSALGKGLRLMRRLGVLERMPRICVGQAEVAGPLADSYRAGWAPLAPVVAGETQASAIRIGNPVSFEKAVDVLREFDGVVHGIGEEELADTSALADRTGLFTCPHTAVALAAFRRLVQSGEARSGDRVVVISTANGLKFPEFKVRYHEGQPREMASQHANQPVECAAEAGAVRVALDKAFQTRAAR